MSDDLDPLSPDAPIQAWLSLSSNKRLATATPEELAAVVSRCRTLASSPQALTSALEKDKPERKRDSGAAAKRKALLAEL